MNDVEIGDHFVRIHHMTRLVVLLSALILFGCSGGDGSTGVDNVSGEASGILTLSLTDAPADGLKAVYITIDEVRVCSENAEESNDVNNEETDGDCLWEVVAEPGEIYNLFELVNGVTETLGVTELSTGTYHQMRLMIGTEVVTGTNILGSDHPHANYLIDSDENMHPLKIPSGVQSGVKLIHEFEIDENMETELVLDFDARKSIVKAGKKDKYILKPTIKVLNKKHVVKLTGRVSDVDASPIPSVAVSAQRLISPSDVIVETSTLTDGTGDYQLLLEKNKEYTIVVFSSEYTPACALINISGGGQPNIWDFSLEKSESGIVSGTITGVTKGADVSLSINKVDQACGNGDQDIELLNEEIAPGQNDAYEYSVALPKGDGYKAVYSDGVNKASKIFNVEAGQAPQTLDLSFD
jgi:hypothetical protein